MRRLVLILIFIISVDLIAESKTDSLMMHANQLFQNQQYNDAVELYQEILEMD